MNGYDDRGTALDPGLTALALRARARTDESDSMMLPGVVMGLVLGVPSGFLLGGLCEANGEDTAATEAPPGGTFTEDTDDDAIASRGSPRTPTKGPSPSPRPAAGTPSRCRGGRLPGGA